MAEFVMFGTLEALTLWLYMLPGLSAVLIYENVAEVTPQKNFDKIIMALLITLASVAISSQIFDIKIVPDFYNSSGKISVDKLNDFLEYNLGLTFVISMILAIFIALLQNTGLLYILLRIFRLTKRTGRIDPWHQVFSTERKKWVSVRFNNGDILIGWPLYYSETGEKKELFLKDATWYWKTNSNTIDKFTIEDVNGPGVFLENFDDVKAVEILN